MNVIELEYEDTEDEGFQITSFITASPFSPVELWGIIYLKENIRLYNTYRIQTNNAHSSYVHDKQHDGSLIISEQHEVEE